MRTLKNVTLIVLFSLLLISGKEVFSQGAAINTTGAGADASAMLDVNSADKGVLVPRINLTSTTVASPVVNPATSLLVYNNATAGDVTPGYYYWDGTQWVKVVSGSSSAADLRAIKTKIYTNVGGQ